MVTLQSTGSTQEMHCYAVCLQQSSTRKQATLMTVQTPMRGRRKEHGMLILSTVSAHRLGGQRDALTA